MDDSQRFLILLVDDSNENLDFLNGALRDDYDIIIARDGNQALRIVKRRRPDLIMLDIVMPHRDGYEVCSELKSNPTTENIPVIFLTGLANQLDKSRGFKLGAVDYITKPFNIVEVKARVKNQLLINQARHLLEIENRQLESEVNIRTIQLDKARENLEATEDKFHTLFQRSVNAAAFATPIYNDNDELIDFTYLDVNINFEKIVAQEREYIIGRNETEIFGKVDETLLSSLRETVKENVDSLFEFYNKALDKYLLGSSFNITSDGNTFAIVLIDITERTRYQDQLIQAKEQAEESDRLKTAFLTNISHEIRTPLNGIIGFSQLMKQENISYGTKENYIKIIEKCSRNLITVIDEIIEFSHIESSSYTLNYAPINLNRFLENRIVKLKEEQVRISKEEIEIIPQFALPSGEDSFVTDRDRIKRIIDNLLSNALKFTDKGSIKVGYRVSKKKKKITLYVKDTGRGISSQKKQIIFKSFRQEEEGYSREYGGVGLGLAISKKIAGQLGGEIRVVSNLGKGSAFSVVLPFRNSMKESHDELSIPTENRDVLRNKWGLILDKDKYSRETLIRLLSLKEMNFMVASNTQEAQRICRDYPEIDFALINQESVEEDLYKLPQLMSSFHRGIKFILLGESPLLAEKDKLETSGYNDVITRPIEPNHLYSAISRCF